MIQIPGFTVGNLLYESLNSYLYRGVRLSDGIPVVFKLLNSLLSPAERRASFVQEYHLTKKLALSGIVTAYELDYQQGVQAIILEDFGGEALDRLDIAGKLSLKEWLRLAMRITECLGQLHGQHIMHKDINPSNIVWNRADDVLKLIDLGISTELSREMPEVRSPEWLEGTLPYLSPEQTGRMNRAIDYRTDFYSLGVTFHELLTGQLPFQAKDAMEMVHAHIAKIPEPADRINPAVPAMVAAIVAKLMAKTAEERYQSTTGLLADLHTCLEQLEQHGEIRPFTLGTRDFSGRLQISQKLYGRQEQITQLTQAFERVAEGAGELLLVSGYSGIGKSALVHEMQKQIVRKRGNFIEGKFDQFKRDIPYTSFIQAFGALIRQILTGGETSVSQWRERLLPALGNNAQVIVNVIPDVELLIGSQPAVAQLPHDRAQIRFNNEFRKFVGALAGPDHPLVIFLDDLQWADLPSLQLLSLLLRSPSLPHVLLIGAYRDNEIVAGDWLSLTLSDMEKSGAAISSVRLEALDLAEIRIFLSETLHADIDRVGALAELCLAKTQGNPFFLNQFLATLVDTGMLRVDSTNTGWEWNVDEIRTADITDNVVDLMIRKLQRLPQPTRRVLQGAACLGNAFDLKTLATVCQMTEPAAADLLWPALRDELVVPLDTLYKYVGRTSAEEASALLPMYRFLHDRVQQAAYLLSTDAERSAMHLAIGRLWKDSLPVAEQESALFELVNHFNLGRSLMEDATERRQLAALNLSAARKAKASMAYKPELRYIETALELVHDQDWGAHLGLMFSLHFEAAEAAYLNIDFERMKRYINIALSHLADPIDRAKLQEIEIRACLAQNKFKEGIVQALTVLRSLGVSLPARAQKFHTMVKLARTRRTLAGHTIEELADLPDCTDERILVAGSIMGAVAPAVYYVTPGYVPLFVLNRIGLVLKHGFTPGSSNAFIMYGMILASVFGDSKKAEAYGALALTLAARPGMRAQECRALVMHVAMITYWTKPIQDSLALAARAYLTGVETADLEYTGKAALAYCESAFFCGLELTGLEKEVERYAGALEQMSGPSSYNSLKVLWQAIQNLSRPCDDPCALQGAIVSEDLMRTLRASTDDRFLQFVLFSTTLIVSFVMGEYRVALENASRAEEYANGRAGMYHVPLSRFYGCLARLALYDEFSPAEQRATLKLTRKFQKKLLKWSEHAPTNFLHKWYLLDAEVARVKGDLKAGLSYDEAIRLARQHNLVQEEALAKELAGRFYLGRGQDDFARLYFTKAWHDYRLWGAWTKVRKLEADFPQWLKEEEIARPFLAAEGETSISQRRAAGTLDIATVMKASQAISSEIVLDRLLRQLMDIVIENAGAQRGVLLLMHDEWRVEAEKTTGQSGQTTLQSIPLNDVDRNFMALSLVNYVARTRKSVLVEDAADEPLVADDPYVQNSRPRSMLVIPILHQRGLMGMLYLENNAASGAFTQSRVELLQLLASQTAISIENARLYAEMEERVQKRTAEVTDAMKVLKETQQQLIFQEKMVSIGTLTAGVAHEINNPANFAYAGTQTLKMEVERFRQFLLALAEGADAAVLKSINERLDELAGQSDLILEGTSRIRDLVRDLRSFARLDEAEKKGVAICDSLMSTVNLVRTQYAGSVEIRCDLAANPVLECWPAQLNQVFMNIVVNGCQSIGKKQKQSGESRPGLLEIRSRIDGDWLELEFEDSGIGIEPEIAGRIFEPFFTTKEVGEGTGLGLSISFGIIEKHHGTITVRSTVGKGSCFTVRLPITPA